MKKYILSILVTSFIFSCNENSINYNQIDSMINNEIEANNIPGAVVLIGDEKGINYQRIAIHDLLIFDRPSVGLTY